MSLLGPILLLAPLVVAQRTVADLPGLEGKVQVRLGDITGGQVWLTVEDRGGGTALFSASVREGASVPFTSEGHAHVLHVDRLENRLIGTDYAHLSLDPSGATPPVAPSDAPVVAAAVSVEALLADLAHADVQFIRNGSVHTAAEAAAHLRSKASSAGEAARTVEGFIANVATKSSTTGQPYRVRHPDGREEDAASWLRARAAALARGGVAPRR